MEDDLTVREAADEEGVTPKRIREFINDGRLDAYKRANVWFIRRESWEAFKKIPRKDGRPPKAS